MLNFLFTQTPLTFLTQSYWRDEAFSVLLAQKNILDVLVLTAKDFSPPLYYLLLRMWATMFGYTEISTRMLSFALFLVLLVGVKKIVNQLLHITDQKQWIYLLLFAINPIIFYYAFETRGYMLLAVAVTWSWYALIKKDDSSFFWFTIVGLYTHYFYVFVLISQAIWTYLHKRLPRREFALASLSFTPWLIFSWMQHSAQSDQFWITNSFKLIVIQWPSLLLTGHEFTFPYPKDFTLLPLTLTLYATFVFMFLRKKHIVQHKELCSAFLLWTFFPVIAVLAISVWKPLFLPRYLIFTTIGFLLLLSYGTTQMRGRLSKLIVVFVILLGSLWYLRTEVQYRKKEPIREVVQAIKKTAGPNDLIYVDDPLNFHTSQYYFDPQRVFIYGKSYDEIPSYVGKVLIPPSAIKTSLPPFPVKAYIITSDFQYHIESMY